MKSLSAYEIEFDEIKLADFDLYKTKYMKKTVRRERNAFHEKDIG